MRVCPPMLPDILPAIMYPSLIPSEGYIAVGVVEVGITDVVPGVEVVEIELGVDERVIDDVLEVEAAEVEVLEVVAGDEQLAKITSKLINNI